MKFFNFIVIVNLIFKVFLNYINFNWKIDILKLKKLIIIFVLLIFPTSVKTIIFYFIFKIVFSFRILH